MQANSLRNLKALPLVGMLLSIFLFGVQGCEKDDICVDGDTPLLVIKFYDTDEPETSKPVTKLRVIGLGKDTPVNTFSDRSTLDSIAIPLRPEEGQTSFVLILDSEDGDEGVEAGNADTLRFTYDTRGEFISRACGFVANYENLNAQLEPDTLNWIQNIEVINSSVQKPDTTHVSIFH